MSHALEMTINCHYPTLELFTQNFAYSTLFSSVPLPVTRDVATGVGVHPPSNNFKLQKIGQNGKDLVKIGSQFVNEIRTEFVLRKLSKKLRIS